MALKKSLISFELKTYKGLSYEEKFDYDFSEKDPVTNEGIQPVIKKIFNAIKTCIALSISSDFTFTQSRIQNLNNFLHVATAFIQAFVQNSDSSQGQTTTLLTVKFYKIEERDSIYKITLDLEQMPSSSQDSCNKHAFTFGISNKQIEKLVELLKEEFKISNGIEYMPIIKLGRLEIPHYLISSDERILEYDFDKLIYHKKSEFQDVKIVSSPSLGNTLLLDNLQNLAEVDLNYTYALMDKSYVSYKDKEILILGGGDGGLLWELLKEEPKFVTMAEIDPVVIEACSKHFRPCGEVLKTLKTDRYEIVIEDCLKTLRRSINEGKKYDMIFNDLTDIPVCKREESHFAFEPSAVQKDSPWHFIEAIFNLSLECLAEDGLYLNHATGKGSIESLNAYNEFLDRSRIKVEYETRESYVPSFKEIWVFYTIKKKKIVNSNSS